MKNLCKYDLAGGDSWYAESCLLDKIQEIINEKYNIHVISMGNMSAKVEEKHVLK